MQVFIKAILFIIFIFSTFSIRLQAADAFRRHVSFELEQVDGAKLYEIELTQLKKDGRSNFFKTKTPQWQGDLLTGHYEMRARTLDRRGVPGEWGEVGAFDVLLDKTKIKYPLSQTQIKETKARAKETEVTFEWEPVEGAISYRFELHNKDGSLKIDKVVTSTDLLQALPVSDVFQWKVSAIGLDNLTSEYNSENEFSIQGPKLESPKLVVPLSAFVRELKWQNMNAKNVALVVNRWDELKKMWILVFEDSNFQENSLKFNPIWPGGKYQISLTAVAPLSAGSDVNVTEFNVFEGDRSTKSESINKQREIEESQPRWTAIAGFHSSQVTYFGTNYDQTLPAQTAYTVLSGTTSLGASYFENQHAWGFLSTLDISRFDTGQGQTNTFAADLSTIWRKSVSRGSEVRVQAGLFYQEFLIAESDGVTRLVTSYSTASVLGPLLQIEFRQTYTQLFGIRVNARVADNLVKMNIPNGQPMDSTFSTRFRGDTSFNLSQRLTVMLGLTQRDELLRYGTITNDPNFIGQKNEMKSSQTSLDISAEYGF